MTRWLRLCVCLMLAGCEARELRVENATGSDLARVVVKVTPELEFGRLADGMSSEFRPVDSMYRYAKVVATTVDGRTWICQPYDFVGEHLVPPGRWTYRLRRPDAGDRLDLECVRAD